MFVKHTGSKMHVCHMPTKGTHEQTNEESLGNVDAKSSDFVQIRMFFFFSRKFQKSYLFVFFLENLLRVLNSYVHPHPSTLTKVGDSSAL